MPSKRITPLIALAVTILTTLWVQAPACGEEAAQLAVLHPQEDVRILQSNELGWASRKVTRLRRELDSLGQEADGRYIDRRQELDLLLDQLRLKVYRLRQADTQPTYRQLYQTTTGLRDAETQMEELHYLIDPDEVPLGAPLYVVL